MGELPEFGINKMMPGFEKAAFALEAPGDYSAPVETSIGWLLGIELELQELDFFLL